MLQVESNASEAKPLESTLGDITLRPPRLEDGMKVFRLVQQCPPLDTNSSYCNLLQTSHFSGTSIAAEQTGELVGFISGYCLPERPDTLFIWQVAVSKAARERGLASAMLSHLLARPRCRQVQFIETTITQSNQASWGLFQRLADRIGGSFQSSPWMDKERHFAGQHDSEALIRIGPFLRSSIPSPPSTSE